MGQNSDIGLDPECLEDVGRSEIGSAPAPPKIDLLTCQISDRLDIWSGQ
jgi:hypothetical protein